MTCRVFNIIRGVDVLTEQTSPSWLHHAELPDGWGLMFQTSESFDSQMNVFEDTFTRLLCD